MGKHRSLESAADRSFLGRGKSPLIAGATYLGLVLTLILGFLAPSLLPSSGTQVLDDVPAVAALPFDAVPDDALTPSPITRADASTKEATPSPTATEKKSAAPPAPAPKPKVAAPAPPPPPPPPAPVAVQAPASAPNRITYASAGIDVAVYPLGIDQSSQASQSIVPPFTLDGYWLTPFGTPGAGSTNTTYVVGHSWNDRDAPFNRLSSNARPGDTFTVTTGTGVLAYRVDSVVTYLKATLKDSDVWNVRPNTIVLISCYTEDPWGKNVVVVASPVA